MIRVDVEGAIVQAAERRVLNDVQFSADSSEWVAIVGPSGAGKSTLLRVMLGLRELTLGSCRVEGREVRSVANRQRSEWLGWLPQRLVIDEPIEVQEIVASARYRFAEPHHEAIAAARSWLRRIGIENLAEQHMTTLSGGESQRVALAMALAQDPRILLLDEPSIGLSPINLGLVLENIQAIRSRGVTVLMVEQNVKGALGISDFAVVMELGKIIANGTAAEIWNDDAVATAYLGRRVA